MSIEYYFPILMYICNYVSYNLYLVGINTPPTLFSLMIPPMAVTRSLSLGLEVLWSTVMVLSALPTLATALLSPRLATCRSPCFISAQQAKLGSVNNSPNKIIILCLGTNNLLLKPVFRIRNAFFQLRPAPQ